jgi:hypothetical protein
MRLIRFLLVACFNRVDLPTGFESDIVSSPPLVFRVVSFRPVPPQANQLEIGDVGIGVLQASQWLPPALEPAPTLLKLRLR